jgi:hypothetical protein
VNAFSGTDAMCGGGGHGGVLVRALRASGG